jgi:hypothetical protein
MFLKSQRRIPSHGLAWSKSQSQSRRQWQSQRGHSFRVDETGVEEPSFPVEEFSHPVEEPSIPAEEAKRDEPSL